MTLITSPRPGINGFAWKNRQELAECLEIVPFVIGGIEFLRRIIPKNQEERTLLSENLRVFFLKQPEENTSQYNERMLIATAKTLTCVAAFAIPMISLPNEFALPAAAISCTIASCLTLQGKELLNHAKTFLLPRNEFPLNEECKKIIKNLALLALAVAFTVTAGILTPQILKKSTEYQLWLPYQNKPVVFLEYLAPAIAHALISYASFQKSKKALGLFHGANTLLSAVFPILYLKYPPLRIHHSLYGQILKLAPSFNLKLLGTLLSASSINYIASSNPHGPGPGYYSWLEYNSGSISDKTFYIYGFDNVLLDHKNLLFLGACGVSLEVMGMALQKTLYSKTPPDPENNDIALVNVLDGANTTPFTLMTDHI